MTKKTLEKALELAAKTMGKGCEESNCPLAYKCPHPNIVATNKKCAEAIAAHFVDRAEKEVG